MREISRRVFTRQVEEVNDLHYVCNKCGVRRRKMLPDAEGKQYPHDADRYAPRDLCDDDVEARAFLHVTHVGGFGDRAFGDETKVEFDLCQDCLLELVKSFVVPAEITEMMTVSLYAPPEPVSEPHPFIDTNDTFNGARDFYAAWATWGTEDEKRDD